MVIKADSRVGTVATTEPATIKIFQEYGIDFCCGGGMNVREACTKRGVPLAAVLTDLNVAVQDQVRQAPNWQDIPLVRVVNHILVAYHAPQREEFARLEQMLEKVLHVHGERWPDLLQPVATTFRALRAEAETHTQDEETRVFPAITSLDASSSLEAASAGLGRLLDELQSEHAMMGTLLADLERQTDGYRVPEGACNTFRGLFHGLQKLADDLRQHIALENHVLFPRAAATVREAAMRCAS